MIGELLVILAVAIVVIKPERLPEMAYLLGKAMLRCRLWYTALLSKHHVP